jgi:hypothetical protein
LHTTRGNVDPIYFEFAEFIDDLLHEHRQGTRSTTWNSILQRALSNWGASQPLRKKIARSHLRTCKIRAQKKAALRTALFKLTRHHDGTATGFRLL